jgi:Xaa-Pro aminopeptidase
MNRVQALQEALLRHHLGAAFITSQDNIRYLTGYYHWNSSMPFAAAVVPARGDPALLVLRADETLARQASGVPVVPYDAAAQGYRATVARLREVLDRGALPYDALGIEFGVITLDRFRILEETFPRHTFADVTASLADLRLVKDESEQTALRRAALLVGSALERTVTALSPGISEIEIKGAMDSAVYAEAARRWSAAIVQSVTNVVSGPKANRLHDAAAGRIIEAGELVFIMGGAILDGYWANAARTVFAPGGPAPAEARRMLDVAVDAQRAAVERLVPGRPLGEAVRAADTLLADAGLLEHKTYPMFRGLGLRHNERPTAIEVDLVLRPGMCLCSQAYLRGADFIVGQSDSILIGENGAVVLTDREEAAR